MQVYDVITMWHVLEHVHALHDCVAQLKNLLKPNGKLIIAVPNYTSADAAYYREFWAAYDVPRHLYHFSPLAMKTLADSHRLKIVRQLPMWFDSFYVSMLSSRYRHGFTNYAGAFLRGCISNIRAMKQPAKGSSVIYIVENTDA